MQLVEAHLVVPLPLKPNLPCPPTPPYPLCMQMLTRMVGRKFLLPRDVVVSPELGDLLGRLLEPEPSRRITLQQVGPFFDPGGAC
jgi:hypothetical protein